MPRAERKLDLRIAAYVGGSLIFSLVLLALGARLEPPTITLVLAAAALGLLLATLFRMVMALARPPAADVETDGGLGDITTRELREEKRRVLRAINELQFDYEMGKLSDADYRSVRELYEARAIEVMRALDQDGALHPEVLEHLAALGIDPESVGHKAPAGDA